MADYRYINLATRQIGWQTSTGLSVNIEVALTQEETDYFYNGDWRPTRNGLSVKYNVTVDGKPMQTGNWIKPTGRLDAPYALGKIGLIKANYDAIMDATHNVQAHPAWVEKIAKEAAALKEEAEYEAHVKRVDDIMTLGGRTY